MSTNSSRFSSFGIFCFYCFAENENCRILFPFFFRYPINFLPMWEIGGFVEGSNKDFWLQVLPTRSSASEKCDAPALATTIQKIFSISKYCQRHSLFLPLALLLPEAEPFPTRDIFSPRLPKDAFKRQSFFPQN